MMEQVKKLTQAERIATRQTRVKQKLNRAGPSTLASQREAEQVTVSKSKGQTKTSRAIVDDTQTTGDTQVTDVQVDRDNQENTRRRRAEQRHLELVEKLAKDEDASLRKHSELSSKWPDIMKQNIPQELYDAIATQYEGLSKIVAAKDENIKLLQRELKTKDEEYVDLLEHQRRDIELLIERSNHAFAQLLKTMQDELVRIEQVFMEERTELTDANKKEMNDLFERRRQLELHIMDAKQAREEGFQKELANIRMRDAEDYNSLKVTLENNIQLLEQQLEDIRSTYQLNQEKLDYNHAVLEERDQENRQTIDHQAKKIRRMKEGLSSAKRAFQDQDKKFADDNQTLTEDYKRITEQFKDLQRKYRHFETVDTKRYREVWEMNEDNVMKVVRKVLKADLLIHEQVLGLKWEAPEGITDIDQVTSAQVVRASDSEVKQLSGAAKVEETQALLNKGKYSREQIGYVMDMLLTEMPFLVDLRVQESIRGMKEDEARTFKIDAILTSLGVEDREDLDELVEHFFEDEKAPEPSVRLNEVVTVVREFVDKRQQSKTKTAGTGIVLKTESVSSEKKARKKERERKFWKKLGNVISEETSSVWTALERGLRAYNTVLEERATMLNETQELARQNAELKHLLEEYLSSKINQELELPPTALRRTDIPAVQGNALKAGAKV